MRFLWWILSAVFIGLLLPVHAQPYIDLATTRYIISPASLGLMNQGEPPLRLNHYVAGFNLPLPLDQKQESILLISPYFENWQTSIPDQRNQLTGIGVPIGLQQKVSPGWSFTALLIYRYNRETNIEERTKSNHQFGSVLIVNRIKSSNLTYKFGLYYNREFFGHFFVPLLGIDWKINEKNNLFGTLPGAITWENKFHKIFGWGLNFRALTNSYRTFSADDPCLTGDCSALPYSRIDENQLGFYLDFYPRKTFAITGEFGHSLFRRTRTGWKGTHFKNVHSLSKQDNFYFRLMASYRLRLR
jgi:hypothetical protein